MMIELECVALRPRSFSRRGRKVSQALPNDFTMFVSPSDIWHNEQKCVPVCVCLCACCVQASNCLFVTVCAGESFPVRTDWKGGNKWPVERERSIWFWPLALPLSTSPNHWRQDLLEDTDRGVHPSPQHPRGKVHVCGRASTPHPPPPTQSSLLWSQIISQSKYGKLWHLGWRIGHHVKTNLNMANWDEGICKGKIGRKRQAGFPFFCSVERKETEALV